jgi:hypothetical protein
LISPFIYHVVASITASGLKLSILTIYFIIIIKMYEEEEDDQVARVQIPKYKVLYMDLDFPKKEGETINTGERLATEGDKKPEEVKQSFLEKILECNLQ